MASVVDTRHFCVPSKAPSKAPSKGNKKPSGARRLKNPSFECTGGMAALQSDFRYGYALHALDYQPKETLKPLGRDFITFFMPLEWKGGNTLG